MTKPDEDAGTKAVNWKPLIILATAVTLVWILSGVAIHWLFDTTDRGTFGDMFGAVNALFSGLERDVVRLNRVGIPKSAGL